MTVTTSLANPLQTTSTVKMSDDMFRQIRDYIYTLTGIMFQDTKKYLLEGRLSKRLQVLSLPNYESYLQLIKFGTRRAEELKFLYDAVTINETFFFRNEPQFEAFEHTLVPQIVASKRSSGKTTLRVWSAASSSGEEAYTLGMLYQERLKPAHPGLDIEIVGTDINSTVLETARQGIYREYSIRNTPKYYLQKYFKAEDSRYYIDESVKRLAKFQHLNLYDRPKMRLMARFDIIFCANVLIYFDAKSKIQVVSDLYDALNPGGFLFIGYAESLHGISTAFKLINFPKTVAYKKE
ncbi:MAG: protein-glutamate O-methyltransferase CheR [Ignavibacteriales bacterium]|nr:protein-glutamate O-methyltransferase CheR [Ignavibacteriales bacterium]